MLPIDPTEANDPTDPIDSTEPVDATESSDRSERVDQRDVGIAGVVAHRCSGAPVTTLGTLA